MKTIISAIFALSLLADIVVLGVHASARVEHWQANRVIVHLDDEVETGLANPS